MGFLVEGDDLSIGFGGKVFDLFSHGCFQLLADEIHRGEHGFCNLFEPGDDNCRRRVVSRS